MTSAVGGMGWGPGVAEVRLILDRKRVLTRVDFPSPVSPGRRGGGGGEGRGGGGKVCVCDYPCLYTSVCVCVCTCTHACVRACVCVCVKVEASTNTRELCEPLGAQWCVWVNSESATL